MKQNQGFSQKFNPNPFSDGKKDAKTDDKSDDKDSKSTGKGPVERNFEINKVGSIIELNIGIFRL